MIIVPEDYLAVKFFQFVGNPIKNRYNNTYQGSCPICREGKSWLKKRRFFYIPDKKLLYCHNCGWSGGPVKWLKTITGMSFDEIKEDIESSNIDIIPDNDEFISDEKEVTDTLPKDCINLKDEIQISFYKENYYVKLALDFIHKRKLDIAINAPDAFYISLDDKVHRNRLIIPFYDEYNKIAHYQSRSLISNDVKPRYMSKLNNEKTIFNINKLDSSFNTYFIFEGPLNSCFCKNGIAVAGIQESSKQKFTNRQQEQINQIMIDNRIWVLDSQWMDSAANKKSKILLEQGETIFIWPENIGTKFKDFNDLVIAANINQISPSFIQKHSHKGMKGLMLLGMIKK